MIEKRKTVIPAQAGIHISQNLDRRLRDGDGSSD